MLSFLRSAGDGGESLVNGRNTPSPLLERRSSSRMGRRPPRSPRSPHSRKQRSTAGSTPKDDQLGIITTRSRVPSFGSGGGSGSGGVRSRIFVSPMSSTASISPPSPRRRSPAFTASTGGRASGIRPGCESPTPLSRNRSGGGGDVRGGEEGVCG